MIQIDPDDLGFTVDAGLLAEAFDIEETRVQPMLRDGRITTLCETGVGADSGRWRLTFWSADWMLRLTVDGNGKILASTRLPTKPDSR